MVHPRHAQNKTFQIFNELKKKRSKNPYFCMTYDKMLVCVFMLCVFVLCVFVLCVCYTFEFHKCQCPTSDILIENKNKIRQLVFSCTKSSVSSIINSVLVKINDFSVLYVEESGSLDPQYKW